MLAHDRSTDVVAAWPTVVALAVVSVSDRRERVSLIAHWFTMGFGAGVVLVLVTRMRSGDGRDRVPLDGQCEYCHSRRAGTS